MVLDGALLSWGSLSQAIFRIKCQYITTFPQYLSANIFVWVAVPPCLQFLEGTSWSMPSTTDYYVHWERLQKVTLWRNLKVHKYVTQKVQAQVIGKTNGLGELCTQRRKGRDNKHWIEKVRGKTAGLGGLSTHGAAATNPQQWATHTLLPTVQSRAHTSALYSCTIHSPPHTSTHRKPPTQNCEAIHCWIYARFPG